MSFLYTLFVLPAELVIEFLFKNIYSNTDNIGVSIIILSVAVNIITIPLYGIADRISETEKRKKENLKKWEDHIKKSFKGDERLMMLQTYYRENGYKPYYFLKSALPLLLQIPFFIAAYVFLINLQELRGAGFGVIADLSKPDSLLNNPCITINLLPVVMTVLNVIAIRLYSRKIRDTLQMYIMAILFLVLLYDSPSGLVLYWTINQLFSVIKNLLVKENIRSKKIMIKLRSHDEELKNNIKSVFPLIAFMFSLCFFATADLYLANYNEFWFTYMDMWSVFAEIFVLFLLLGLLVFRRMEGISLYIGAWFYGLNIVFLLQGKMLPYDYGQLNGERIDWSSFGLRPFYNTMLWIIIPIIFVLLAAWRKEKAAMIMRNIAFMILIVQVISLLFLVREHRSMEKDTVNGYISTENEFSISSGQNTIVLLLDAFDAELIMELQQRYQDEVEDTFKDFTFYHNTLGASGNTLNSVPVYLSGMVNSESLDYNEYMKKAYTESPLIKELSENDYNAGFYVSTYLVDPVIRKAADNYKIEQIKVKNQLGIGIKFLQLVGFKYSPHILKRFFWLYTEEFNNLKNVEENDIYNTNNFVFYDKLCNEGFDILSDEKCFRYYHIDGTHVPYNMNEECDYVENEEDVSLLDQARGCMKIVREFVSDLKSAGVYDNTAIIIMADHGWVYHDHQNPLFMVKQRKESKPVEVSEMPLSYLDVADILCDLLKNERIDLNDYRREKRYYYDVTEIKGITTQTEYLVTGAAYDESSDKETGRVFSW